MTSANLIALLPIIVLAVTVVVELLAIAFYRNHQLSVVLALLGLLLAFLSIAPASAQGTQQVTPLLIIDGYALLFAGMLIAVSFAVAVLAYFYLEQHDGYHEEFYVLLLLATIGCLVLAASSHFASFFLGLEILSVSLYALIGYQSTSVRSIEAGIKYLVLAGASAAFLLFGMALIYAETGDMSFTAASALGTQAGIVPNAILLTGYGMLIVGIGFKLAVVPFHMWTPDVYEGAPAPVTAFVATASKGAMFALLLRYFTRIDVTAYPSLFALFGIIAVLSMVVGNLLALQQMNVKRILAYSSIAHLGYLFTAFLASGANAAFAVTFYLMAYFVTTLGAFGVVGALSTGERDADSIDDYRGLMWRRPGLAAILSAMLLSLAGIPLTAGFVGKFYLLTVGLGSALWVPALALVLGSAIGLYYYLRIIVAMYLQPVGAAVPADPPLPLPGGLVLAVLGILLLWLGLQPAPFIQLIQTAIGGKV